MIPYWIYVLMVEDRARCSRAVDEHGRPVEEQSHAKKGSSLAFPGYKDPEVRSVVERTGAKSELER